MRENKLNNYSFYRFLVEKLPPYKIKKNRNIKTIAVHSTFLHLFIIYLLILMCFPYVSFAAVYPSVYSRFFSFSIVNFLLYSLFFLLFSISASSCFSTLYGKISYFLLFAILLFFIFYSVSSLCMYFLFRSLVCNFYHAFSILSVFVDRYTSVSHQPDNTKTLRSLLTRIIKVN